MLPQIGVTLLKQYQELPQRDYAARRTLSEKSVQQFSQHAAFLLFQLLILENPAHNLPVAGEVEDVEVRDFDVVRPRKPDNTQDILERIEVFAALPPTLFRQGKIRYHRVRKRIEKYPQGQQLRVADSRIAQ